MGEQAVLALADGRVFRGSSIGVSGATVGEVVFTTGLSGYQEVLSDPSYSHQIVTMTCAEIGNVGINEEDFESDRIQAAGLVVRSSRPVTSNWRAEKSLRECLQEQGVVAIEGIDTRALVLHIRDKGAQMGVISDQVDDVDSLIKQAQGAETMAGRDLARVVTCKNPYDFVQAPSSLQSVSTVQKAPQPRKVVVYDFGVKKSILRRLVEAGADVHVVPAQTSANEVLALNPDGVLFSNGPGDPEPCTYAIEAAQQLIGKKPLMGICLGFQILALAYGGRSYKLKFGHRGSNQPVRHEPSGRVMITSQNHGFAIDPDSLSEANVQLTETNLNDQTLSGFDSPSDRLVAVQYHPEASPGPHDATDHFARFIRMCE
jgi:carbamoyl-phosphate synthase small subunit